MANKWNGRKLVGVMLDEELHAGLKEVKRETGVPANRIIETQVRRFLQRYRTGRRPATRVARKRRVIDSGVKLQLSLLAAAA